MRGNFENKTERSSNSRDYRLLLDGSFNFLLLIYLMHREHTFYLFARYLRDCKRTSFCLISRVTRPRARHRPSS